MTTTTPAATPKKRGPKHKPESAHHVPGYYKHAPDVAELLKTLPKSEKSRIVDQAIRVFLSPFKKEEEKGTE